MTTTDQRYFEDVDTGADLPPMVKRASRAQLFLYSAATSNPHRIHYDRDYAREEEGYPGLIVHGPLTAILLADLVRRNGSRRIGSFSFRGAAPLFDLAPVRLRGRKDGQTVELEARGPDEKVALVSKALIGN